MSRFSEVFNIILNSRTEKDIKGTFNILLGWRDYKDNSSLINHYTSGERQIKKDYVDALINPNGINDAKESIINNKLSETIINKSQLASDLINQIKRYTVDNESIEYLISISKNDFPLFLSSILYLAVTDKDSLLDVIDMNNNSEYIYEEEQELFRKSIWKASQTEYFISHRNGNRFANLNIIESLLPKGYIESELLEFYFDSQDNKLRSIDDICNSTEDNILVTGEGGIGKTTFLQTILNRSFGTEEKPVSYYTGCIIPIFIELNRCPNDIDKWYESQYNKTNFITRYIADSIQHLNIKHRDYNSLLSKLENEFRTDLNNRHIYLLLLDGFNEVSTDNNEKGESVRLFLSNEISELQKLPNIRIITTSRITQSAYFATSFTRVHLKGLTNDDIVLYLKKRRFSPIAIEQISNNTNLMKCLSVPLFLIMFSFQENSMVNSFPETYGEIMYNFFHKDSKIYNLRKRFNEANKNPFGCAKHVTEVILDFIIPYIAWHFIQHDTFAVCKSELIDCIHQSLIEIKSMSHSINECPLSDFEYDKYCFINSLSHFESNDNTNSIIESIISCIQDHLGILYSYKTKNHNVINIQYGFIHHHFRDYFSAIWNIYTLKFFLNINDNNFDTKVFYPRNILECQWNNEEADIIGQILQEHKNKPIFVKETGNWILPNYTSDNQSLLLDALNYCRVNKNRFVYNTLLRNIIKTLSISRGELSGINFDQLDMSACNLYNINCSKKGNSYSLAASFIDSKLSFFSLHPSEHLNNIDEFHYSNNYCITMDLDNVIKVWDVISGNQISNFAIEDIHLPSIRGFQKDFIRISSDSRLLAVNIKNNKQSYIYIFNLLNDCLAPYKIVLPELHTEITDFKFCKKDNSLIVLADNKYILYYQSISSSKESLFINYTLSIESEIDNLYQNSDIFIYNEDTIYIHSHDLYSLAPSPNGEKNTTIRIIDGKNDSVSCLIFKYSISSNKQELIYEYKSPAFRMPVFTFLPIYNYFIIYNNTQRKIQIIDCEYKKPINHLQNDINTMPSNICTIDDESNCIYIMYNYSCYKAVINRNGISQIINKIIIPKIDENTKNNSSHELEFITKMIPSNNRFLLTNINNKIYEWNIEKSFPKLKYNTRFFDTITMFKDDSRDIFFIIHEQNGVSLFSQSTCKLVNSYCFNNINDYHIYEADYSEQTGMLFLLFDRGMHSFIQQINIDTGESKCIFSKETDFRKYISIHVSDDGLYILICDSKHCYEYSVLNDELYTVCHAEKDIELFNPFYNNNQINIGISESNDSVSIDKTSRCEVYNRNENGTYNFLYGYHIPTINQNLIKYFLHSCRDRESYITYNQQKNKQKSFENQYEILRGFFIHSSPAIFEILKVKQYTKDINNKIIELDNISLPLSNMLFVKFCSKIRFEIDIEMNTYSYLSKNHAEATSINSGNQILYWRNLKKDPTQIITFDYEQNPELYIYKDAFWEFALPIKNNKLICCYNLYKLFIVDALNGHFIEEIKYLPGLSIADCNFKRAEMSDECKQLIISNGGIV